MLLKEAVLKYNSINSNIIIDITAEIAGKAASKVASKTYKLPSNTTLLC